ncbi:MAG: nicotinate-nucleotide--dimethylbenzimidazole phosphoribosyltransferase [Rhizobiaceae bacterium]|nr:nicotinate-nucleotide--dimethylbenzimidazole phosphoribosyltransferase [Rhizobiaceae bacterium]
MHNTFPFDDFRRLLSQMPQPDDSAAQAARMKLAARGEDIAASRFGDLAAWFAATAGASRPVLRPQVAIFAGTHGVLRHGISRRSLSSTLQVVENCGNGSAAICRLCQANEFGLKVFDLALDLPTADITRASALDERSCAATMAFGMEALMDKPDILCLASFGAGGSTVAVALLAALHGEPSEAWLSGGDPELFDVRKSVVDEVLARHEAHCRDPLEALCRIGGREFAAIAGAILAARMERVPVVLHGHAAFAAAAVLAKETPDALLHCVLADIPVNPRARQLADSLGLLSVFDAGFGPHDEQPLSGALALSVVKSAVATAL